MRENTYQTFYGTIHYWSSILSMDAITLIFLPGLTADHRLIHIEGCPQCGGKMKYYNKPVEWREILRSDGSTKREVTKRIPVLECKRNAEHWYAVDPAEDRVK